MTKENEKQDKFEDERLKYYKRPWLIRSHNQRQTSDVHMTRT